MVEAEVVDTNTVHRAVAGPWDVAAIPGPLAAVGAAVAMAAAEAAPATQAGSWAAVGTAVAMAAGNPIAGLAGPATAVGGWAAAGTAVAPATQAANPMADQADPATAAAKADPATAPAKADSATQAGSWSAVQSEPATAAVKAVSANQSAHPRDEPTPLRNRRVPAVGAHCPLVSDYQKASIPWHQPSCQTLPSCCCSPTSSPGPRGRRPGEEPAPASRPPRGCPTAGPCRHAPEAVDGNGHRA